MNNGDEHQPQAGDWLDLTYMQRRGIRDFNLNLAQVRTENFGEHTMRAMLDLRQQGRVQNWQEAFAEVQGLNRGQTTAMVDFNFQRNQVTIPNFGDHTHDAILAITQQGNAAWTPQMALNVVAGLGFHETAGVLYFGLNRQQVSTPNFGEHTLHGIANLRAHNPNLSIQNAFNIIVGLNPIQVHGITFMNLTRDQVEAPNFDQHTLNAISRLIVQQRAGNTRAAFEMVRGLDRNQSWGVDFYRLRRQDVMSPNFGRHTLFGMDELRFASKVNQNRDLTYQVSFERLRDLTEIQVRGVVEFNLNREQVHARGYGPGVLRTMQALQTLNFQANSDELYRMAMQLPEYQIRAINAYGFIPQQLGLAYRDNQFVQTETHDPDTITGRMVDAISHLITVERMEKQQAIEASRDLNTYQILGMIDFGLTLEQVQKPIFNTDGIGIINALYDEFMYVDEEGHELHVDVPLSPEDQQRARDVIDEVIERYIQEANNLDTLQQPENTTDTSVSAATSLWEFFNPFDHWEIPQHSVRQSREFLEEVSRNDLMGVFNEIINSIDQKQESRAPSVADDASEAEEDQKISAVATHAAAQSPQTETKSVSAVLPGSTEDLQALEDEIVEAVKVTTGGVAAARQTENQANVSTTNTAERGYEAFVQPSGPGGSKSSARKSRGKANLKDAPPGSDSDKKQLPKSKRKGPRS